jgi:hypothetical protein
MAGVIRSYVIGVGTSASSSLVRGWVMTICSFPCVGGGMTLVSPILQVSVMGGGMSSPVDGRNLDTVEDECQEECFISSFLW